MIDYKKTWRNGDGPLLGITDIVSPWNGQMTEAVVDITAGQVIAAHGATCTPFSIAVPAKVLDQVRLIGAAIEEDLMRQEEEPPMALTDAALPVMEAWIRKRGYAPFTDTATGAVTILCTECLKEECKCPIPF